ncbi:MULTISPECIES: hypothetical protein [unclassified Streptomyces]|uniref:hypothetical protein n=1 Tax=unclassified Streptomyces TaxID=2593676 RepID=UPI000AEF4CA6|nr:MULTISPECIES: hypothetical protein [unclassified Streptomyces]
MRMRATLATAAVAAATITGTAVAPASAVDGPSSITDLALGDDVRCAVAPLLQNDAIASLVGESAPAGQCAN